MFLSHRVAYHQPPDQAVSTDINCTVGDRFLAATLFSVFLILNIVKNPSELDKMVDAIASSSLILSFS